MRPADYNEIRDRLFLPWHTEGKGWATIFAMFNSTAGGGGAGRILSERTGNVMIAGRSPATFIHEFGHTALGLPDEYTSAGTWGIGRPGGNATTHYNRDEVQWRAWIEPGTEIPTPYTAENRDKIGVFTGTQHRVAHIYRSTARACIMGAGSAFGDRRNELCPICIQRSVSRMYMWVDPFDSVYPARKELTIDNPGTLHFSVDVIKPLNDTQKLSWYLNGRIIAEGVSEVDVTFGGLERYELECRLVDETRFVRPDLPFVDYPGASVKWTIINEEAEDAGEHLTVDLKGSSPVPGAYNGSIKTTVSGGTPPYLFEWNDNVKTRDRKNLAPGAYTLTVYDSQFRSTEKEIVLSYPENFAPRIVSTKRDGLWDLKITGIDSNPVTFLWSDGKRGSEREGLPDGFYSCTITDMYGNRATRDITLKSTGQVFNAKLKEVIPSTGNQNNGSVSLHIEGGREPYTLKWSDGVITDSSRRDFLVPGSYTVEVSDLNGSLAEKDFVIKRAEAFYVEGLQFRGSGNSRIRISNPDRDYTYLWYIHDIPDYVPQFPSGHFYGTCETDQGEVFKAQATIINNRGGVFIQDTDRNDFGRGIRLSIFTDGEDRPPVVFELQTSQDGRFAEVLRIEDEKTSRIVYDDNFRYDEEEVDITWNGVVEDGYLRLTEEGFLNSTLELSYSSYYDGNEEPVSRGLEFTPSKPGNYYVASQNKATGAISLNRAGVAVTETTDLRRVRPADPSNVRSSNLIMWLDANDLSADGKPDGKLLRRGSANAGRCKAGDIEFHFFNYFPNAQNGKPIASWSTIWVQSLSSAVNNYQTIIMVRRENGFSGVGSSPYRELNSLIGVGSYGENLFHDDLSSHTLNGRVRINSETIDPLDYSMPEGFYIATYEFDSVMDNPFRVTDGHWEGDIAEILVFDSVLSENELERVEEYLYRKWISGVESDFSLSDNISADNFSGFDFGVDPGANSCVCCN